VAETDSQLAALPGRAAELEAELAKLRNSIPPPKSEWDDLKLIWGIGPVLEKKLHGLGIYFFRQIAAWKEADIERISASLKEFPDRIRRDNWVKGAAEEHAKKYGKSARA
jgi:NADH-quinone oxidoreductase subunit E